MTHNLQFSAYGQSVIHFEDVKQLNNIEMNILTSYYSIAEYLVKSRREKDGVGEDDGQNLCPSVLDR